LSEQRFRSNHGKPYRVVDRLGVAGGFGSVVLVEDAEEVRAKLLASGVLDRFPNKDMPKVVEEKEAIIY
jgi:hypothetical protein